MNEQQFASMHNHQQTKSFMLIASNILQICNSFMNLIKTSKKHNLS
jgi:hypothetical protein